MDFADPKTIEAFAEAWASIDGRQRLYQQCKADKATEDAYGHYAGYYEDAKELLKRAHSRLVSTPQEQEEG